MKSFFVRRSTLTAVKKQNTYLINRVERAQEYIDKVSKQNRVGDYEVRVSRKFGEWWCDLYRHDYKSLSPRNGRWDEVTFRIPPTPTCTFIERMGPFKTQTKAIKAGHKYVYKRRVDSHIAKADSQVNTINETMMTV